MAMNEINVHMAFEMFKSPKDMYCFRATGKLILRPDIMVQYHADFGINILPCPSFHQ
jgi:hypothetical protein